jgi:hypothetical protein
LKHKKRSKLTLATNDSNSALSDVGDALLSDKEINQTPITYEPPRRSLEADKAIEGMMKKYGQHCGVPEQYRHHLEEDEWPKHFRSIYSNIRHLKLKAMKVLQYFWAEQGLWTVHGKEKGNMHYDTMRDFRGNILWKPRGHHY